MIDFGLLASMIVAFGVPTLVNQLRWPLRSFGDVRFLDAALAPAVVAVVVGRLAAVALDDPGGFTRFGDLLIIRSGVEFWAGLLAAVAVLAWTGRNAGAPARLADIAPLAMVGYACYEATCVLRDGCFGPTSSIGLRPPGLVTTMLPVGAIVGLVIVLGAVVVRKLNDENTAPFLVLAVAAVVVAGVRAIASIWLPHVGDGLTRPHRTSIVIAILAILCAVVVVKRVGWRESSPTGSR